MEKRVGSDKEEEEDGLDIPRAFHVEGERPPHEELPLDGHAYLQSVRWEARRMPGVVIASDFVSYDDNKFDDLDDRMPLIYDVYEHLGISRQKKICNDFEKQRAKSVWQKTHEEKNMEVVNKTKMMIGKNSSIFSELPPLKSFMFSLDNIQLIDLLDKIAIYLDNNTSNIKKDRKEEEEEEEEFIDVFHVCSWIFSVFLLLDIPLNADVASIVRKILIQCYELHHYSMKVLKKTSENVKYLDVIISICARFFGQEDVSFTI